ncbi:dehydrogenase [Endozoicomonas atrinae]|uniref:GHMP family kinase ATP-binding protein n=1 Tax=Endozoicomonas atrinae TaxID=1333660 RepID=UPI00082484C6|nr:dehydrogenase [Endozoicomonas atrinae]
MTRVVRSRAPLRLGIAGGGTDVSPYADVHTGYILNATIERYAYCTIEDIKEPKINIVATDRNIDISINYELYPFELDGMLDLHKAVYNRMVSDFNNNKPTYIKITTSCDAPVGSGLGASSTLVVAMIKCFDEYFNVGMDDYQIAYLAYQIERNDCNLHGGRQDQYSATFGGFNFMEFYSEDRVLVNPLRIKNWIICELEASLILYYTGRSRLSGSIIDQQVEKIQSGVSQSIEAMHSIKEAALTMKEALLKGDFDSFIENLNLSWESKKRTAESISNPEIDSVFQSAMSAGALGGKISGAGGGGFMMLFVKPEKKDDVISILKKSGGWTSNCQFSHEGSQCWTVHND